MIRFASVVTNYMFPLVGSLADAILAVSIVTMTGQQRSGFKEIVALLKAKFNLTFLFTYVKLRL